VITLLGEIIEITQFIFPSSYVHMNLTLSRMSGVCTGTLHKSTISGFILFLITCTSISTIYLQLPENH
jgi:hypothetical protein